MLRLLQRSLFMDVEENFDIIMMVVDKFLPIHRSLNFGIRNQFRAIYVTKPILTLFRAILHHKEQEDFARVRHTPTSSGTPFTRTQRFFNRFAGIVIRNANCGKMVVSSSRWLS
jgi:hypothetical protein